MDAQTLVDLEILESADGHSLFQQINYTISQGGEHILKKKLTQPFLTANQIKTEQQRIQKCIPVVEAWRSLIHERDIVAAELYLQSNIQIVELENTFLVQLTAKFFRWQHPDYFHYLNSNILSLFDLLKRLQQLLQQHHFLLVQDTNAIAQSVQHLNDKILLPNLHALENKKAFNTLYVDSLLRKPSYTTIKNILEWIYETDAIMAMAYACVQHHLHFPEIVNEPVLSIKGLRHIMLKNAVVNNVTLTKQHIMFVTGPNMAGKTTYLKANAQAVLFAHIGMGIPAESAQIGVLQNIFTFIGITDSISKGESYFQAEINRIKLLAECLQENKAVLCVIDEPFKGTNIKDALYCTLLFTELALKWHQSFFIIATHLTEIYEKLADNQGILFNYFETHQDNDTLKFDYVCKPGISEQRLGLNIFKQTGLPHLMQPKNE
jgi:DNA mismatch repair ATPase MutS